MNQQDMLNRTKAFALRTIQLVAALPHDRVGNVIGKQVLRSGTSVGANYREAMHASSRKQFVAMLEIAQREAEETLYWIELIVDSGLMDKQRLIGLADQCRELLAILTASIRTARSNGH